MLWLFKRVIEGQSLGPYSTELMMYVFRFGLQEDLSFDGVGRSLKAMLGDLYDRPFTETDYENSQKMRKFAEERRVKAMQEYLANKIRNN